MKREEVKAKIPDITDEQLSGMALKMQWGVNEV